MADLSIKDPSCYHVTLIGYNSDVGTQLAQGNPIGAITAGINGTNIASLLDPSSFVTIEGVFASDGNAVSVESTTEEDEYTEALDGSVCVFPKSNKNRILTIRLNSCNGVVDDIIALKNRRVGSIGGRQLNRTPFYFQFCDYCTGYSLVSECAWILTNPSLSFGQDDSAVEIRILLVSPRDNALVFSSQFNDRSVDINDGGTNVIQN